jgi:hypothetical protein
MTSFFGSFKSYTSKIQEILDLPNCVPICSLAESFGLKILNVAWEDTARTKGSCYGPNISDLTLCVQDKNMPIIRAPNFADITSDQNISNFSLIVGNEHNTEKKIITLKEYLQNIKDYTNNSKLKSMYLDRDEKILTSAQACVLPLDKDQVVFNVNLYNYQSYESNPAVLVIVSSSEGTSTQIVYGQNNTLYFNKNGQNSNYIAERLSDDRKKRGVPLDGPMTHEEKQRNALLIFQIPLKRKPRESRGPPAGCSGYSGYYGSMFTQKEGCSGPVKAAAASCSMSYCDTDDNMLMDDYDTPKGCVARSMSSKPASRGFEHAVIKTSESFGKFIGTKDLELERDPDYPIRCTIQFYSVTDTSDISRKQIEEISERIKKVYDMASITDRGSLVCDGVTERKTEPSFVETKPFDFGDRKTLSECL